MQILVRRVIGQEDLLMNDLQNCKQGNDESIRDYYKRFAEIRSTLVDVSERDVIDYFSNGLKGSLCVFFFHNWSWWVIYTNLI